MANQALVNPSDYYADQFYYLYTTVTGNCELIARLTSIPTGTGIVPQAGIALRGDSTANCASMSVFYSPDCTESGQDQVQASCRPTWGQGRVGYSNVRAGYNNPVPSALPAAWLRVDRYGNDCAAYWSRDGVNWIPFYVDGAFEASGSVEIGLFVASNSNTTAETCTFDNVTLNTASTVPYKTSWTGNSFAQGSEGFLGQTFDDGHIGTNIAALTVNADGTCWTNSNYSEAGGALDIFDTNPSNASEGQLVKQPYNIFNGAGGANEGSLAADGSSEFVYSSSTSANSVFANDLNGNWLASLSFSGTLGAVTGMALTPTNLVGITNVTDTAPMEVTTASAHNLVTGDRVDIGGVAGNTAANGSFPVQVIDSTHVYLNPVYRITAATDATPIKITTSAANGLVTGNVVNIQDVLGNTAANSPNGVYQWVVTVLNSTQFTLNGSVGNGTYTANTGEVRMGFYSPTALSDATWTQVTGATDATPIVITTISPNPLTTGQYVTVAGVAGCTAADGTWQVTYIDPYHVSLNGSVGNGTYKAGSGSITPGGSGAYTSGGSMTYGRVRLAVSGATDASPIQITTSVAHGLTTGESVTISGVTGNTAANGTWVVTVVDSTHVTLNGSTGNAAYVSGGLLTYGELYVSDNTNSEIRVVDTTSYSELPSRAFAFTQNGASRPGPMCVDKRGNLWIIQEGATSPLLHQYLPTTGYTTGIYCYTKYGVQVTSGGNPVQITTVAFPTSVSYNPYSDELIVCDNGPNQQVDIFSNLTNATPTLASTFGNAGGIYSTSSTDPGGIDSSVGGYASFYSLTGAGVDAAGNIYVACDGMGSDLRKFSSAGAFDWSLVGDNAAFLCGDFDPANGDMFSFSRHYAMNYSNAAPGSEWSYTGFTIAPTAYPSDPRVASNASGDTWVRRMPNSSGARFLFMSTSYGLEFYRFSGSSGTGDTAIPCGSLTAVTNNEIQLWVDGSDGGPIDGIDESEENTTIDVGGPGGNGELCVDASGDIWWNFSSEIYEFVCTGILNGVPQYDLGADLHTYAYPSGLSSIGALHYDSANNIMYLGATTPQYPVNGVVGTVICRYDNWTTTPTLHYQLVLPSDVAGENFSDNFFSQGPPWGYDVQPFFKSMDVAGNFIFAWDEFGQIHVYDCALANNVLNIFPGPENDGIVAWTDPAYAHAFERTTGEYELTMEDSGIRANNPLYRWTPATPTSVPAAPTNLASVSTEGQIALTWTGPYGLLSPTQGYSIYRGTTSGGETLYKSDVLAPQFTDTAVTSGVTYYYEVTAWNAAGQSPKSNEVTGVFVQATATFVKLDTTTSGSWVGVYGSQGNDIPGAANNLPSSILFSTNATYTSLQIPSGANSNGTELPPPGSGFEFGYWSSGTTSPFYVGLNFTDGETHQLAVYCVDYYGYGLSENIEVIDPSTGDVLPNTNELLDPFETGTYVVYDVTGNIEVQCTGNSNGFPDFIDGLFVDP